MNLKKTSIIILALILAFFSSTYVYEKFIRNKIDHWKELAMPPMSHKSLLKEILAHDYTYEEVKKLYRDSNVIEFEGDLIVPNAITKDYKPSINAHFHFSKRYIVWGEKIIKDVTIYNGDLPKNKPKNIEESVIITKESNQNYCSLTSLETFSYLYSESPFSLGSNGTVNFSKRFSYEHNTWIEDRITILGGRARLEGNWKVIRGNQIRVSNILATNGMFDASRNTGSAGLLTIKCNGDIEGTLRDRNGNSKDILIEKN